MKKLTTAICSICLAYIGYLITDYSSSHSVDLHPQNALHAATIPSWNYNGQLPLDLQLDAAKRIKPDTIVIHDTVTVNNTKYIRVPVPQCTTDTIYVPMANLPEIEVLPVKNRSPGSETDNEPDEAQSVVLIIAGKEVYSSKTSKPEVSDEPQKL